MSDLHTTGNCLHSCPFLHYSGQLNPQLSVIPNCRFRYPLMSADLQRILANPEATLQWLAKIGIVEEDRALSNLKRIIGSGMSNEGVSNLALQLNHHLPVVSDPDLALNNLERFLSSAPNSEAWGTYSLKTSS